MRALRLCRWMVSALLVVPVVAGAERLPSSHGHPVAHTMAAAAWHWQAPTHSGVKARPFVAAMAASDMLGRSSMSRATGMYLIARSRFTTPGGWHRSSAERSSRSMEPLALLLMGMTLFGTAFAVAAFSKNG